MTTTEQTQIPPPSHFSASLDRSAAAAPGGEREKEGGGGITLARRLFWPFTSACDLVFQTTRLHLQPTTPVPTAQQHIL